MQTQLLVVYALIGLACLFVLRSTARAWLGTARAGCGSGCGRCAAPAAEAAPTKRRGLPVVEAGRR